MHGLSILLLGLGGFVVTSFSSHADQEYSWLQLRNFVKRPAFLCCAMTMIAVTTFLVGRALWNRFLDLLSFTYLFAVTGAVDLLDVTKFTLQLLRLLVVVKTEQEEPAKKVVSTCIVMTLALHFGVFCFQVAAAYYRKALQSLPLFLGSGALMQVVVCGTFFDEFSSLEKHQKVFFSVGLALVMLGMVVTSMAGEEPQARQPAAKAIDLKACWSAATGPSLRPIFFCLATFRRALCAGFAMKAWRLQLGAPEKGKPGAPDYLLRAWDEDAVSALACFSDNGPTDEVLIRSIATNVCEISLENAGFATSRQCCWCHTAVDFTLRTHDASLRADAAARLGNHCAPQCECRGRRPPPCS
ncbi:unnamed protein product [Effrenium voratum]|uniref:Uncharacterized protein n=1 Tax=Effrenium voratum TaxID=2562239 RepID=A0AA36J9G2_9DINO|nr:unnamed protein product [Effrenium voratum]